MSFAILLSVRPIALCVFEFCLCFRVLLVFLKVVLRTRAVFVSLGVCASRVSVCPTTYYLAIGASSAAVHKTSIKLYLCIKRITPVQ